jgi:hypothetical protein
VEDAYDRETAEDALRQAHAVCAFVEENLRNAGDDSFDRPLPRLG